MRKPPVRSYIHIAEPRARATSGDQPVLAGEHRDDERQEVDQVGGVAAQPLALVQRLVDEPDVALLEVAQAAVDELRALRDVPWQNRRASTRAVRSPRVGRVEGDPAPVMPPPTTKMSNCSAPVGRASSDDRTAARPASGGGRQPRDESVRAGVVCADCPWHPDDSGSNVRSARRAGWGSIRVASGCRLAEARSLSRPRRQHLLPGRRRRCGGGQIGLRGLRGAGGVPRARPDVTGEGRRLGWRHRARTAPDHPPTATQRLESPTRSVPERS